MQAVNAAAPKFSSIETEIRELRRSYPNLSKKELADKYGNRLRSKYTNVGVVTALPGAIPGIGTKIQIAVEVGSISADLALMLRWMAAMCYGIALIYEKDISSEFNQEFIKVLGVWCKVITIAKEATSKIATRIAVVQFNKRVSSKILQRINQRVGTTIITKYGTKRGGVALGRLIPFGVGAAVGGTFNFVAMNAFKKAALKYYQSTDNEFIYVDFEEVK